MLASPRVILVGPGTLEHPEPLRLAGNGRGARLLDFLNEGSKPAACEEGRMEVLHGHCAGLDIHKDTVAACVRHMVGDAVKREVKTFKTATKDLMAVSD